MSVIDTFVVIGPARIRVFCSKNWPAVLRIAAGILEEGGMIGWASKGGVQEECELLDDTLNLDWQMRKLRKEGRSRHVVRLI